MYPDLAVDADDLHHTATAMAGTADRLTAGTREEPTVDPTPGWATTEVAIMAGAAAGSRLGLLGDDLADTARSVHEAAEAYADADARAATRLTR